MRRFLAVLAVLCPFLSLGQLITLKGKVTNEQMEPIVGATITIKGSNRFTSSNSRGEFTLKETRLLDTLIVSSVGYETREVSNNERGQITVILKRRVGVLDEAVVIAYGTTTRRLNTGSVGRINAQEIAKQPVSNVLSALSGRVPGLVITENSGVPGAGITVQIRGRNSIEQGSDPLFIIDGVPYAPNNAYINQLVSAANVPGSASQGGMSPFNTINAADIESIEILKDADATAIYGSRGANGVVLITTKKGITGKTTAQVTAFTSWSRVTRTTDMLTTPQYLQMRREAFANDGTTPTTNNAPDLLVWDTTRHTDFQKLLIGGVARKADAQVALSGGTQNTHFRLGTGYHYQTTVYPGNLADRRVSASLHLTHSNPSRRFTIDISTLYATGKNNLLQNDLTYYIKLPPNAPLLYDSTGKLAWQEGGAPFDNPLAYLRRSYTAQSNNLVSSLQLTYRIAGGLTLKTGLGFNQAVFDETSLTPKEAQNPANNPSGSSQFGSSDVKSWITEPQVEYTSRIGRGKLIVLAGGSWQQSISGNSVIVASGYQNDALLQSLTGASDITVNNSYSQYRYAALFGRANYSWEDRLLVNLSGRRDGSSRFGPGRQFASFGAAGAAWIFSKEKWWPLAFISYGKLRASYGATGNDQIGNYQYLDSWNATSQPYQGTMGLKPARLFNPDYSWEVNRKWEGALELGFLKDRMIVSVAGFRNRTGNQLIQYLLPAQAGFRSVIENFPAVVENKGLEVSLEAKLANTALFNWSASAHTTIHRNKLVSFPGLAASSYASKLIEGESLNLVKGYRSLGVDPATGVFLFDDTNKDGIVNSSDYVVLGTREPRYYGGFSNNIRYKGWQANVFIEFRKQTGSNYLASIRSSFLPGRMYNQPVEVLERWQHPGDVTGIQRFTTTSGRPAYAAAAAYLPASDLVFTDASFIRFKTIALSYHFPSSWIQKIGAGEASCFLNSQNLFTLTGYRGADPETQQFYVLPPLRTLAVGIQITF